MENVVAEFEKVSFSEFFKAFTDLNYNVEVSDNFKDSVIRRLYDSIKLPKRATTGSAGYDFFAPFDFDVSSGVSITIPTGIRCRIKNGWMLSLFPRSGLGFKHQLRLDNTVGIIDSDYYYSDNEGHIMIKMSKGVGKDLYIGCGKAFAQGIFLPYGITESDDAIGTRNGGFGSTDTK